MYIVIAPNVFAMLTNIADMRWATNPPDMAKRTICLFLLRFFLPLLSLHFETWIFYRIYTIDDINTNIYMVNSIVCDAEKMEIKSTHKTSCVWCKAETAGTMIQSLTLAIMAIIRAFIFIYLFHIHMCNQFLGVGGFCSYRMTTVREQVVLSRSTGFDGWVFCSLVGAHIRHLIWFGCWSHTVTFARFYHTTLSLYHNNIKLRFKRILCITLAPVSAIVVRMWLFCFLYFFGTDAQWLFLWSGECVYSFRAGSNIEWKLLYSTNLRTHNTVNVRAMAVEPRYKTCIF